MRQFLTILIFFSTFSIRGQNKDGLNLSIKDKNDGQSIPFCNIEVYQNGKLLEQKESNFDGKLKLLPFRSNSPIILSFKYVGFLQLDTLIDISNFNAEQLLVQLTRDTSHLDFRTLYNQKTALNDLKSGNVKILFTGLVFKTDLRVINNCVKKFGFEYTGTTDVINMEEHLYEAVRSYNNVIITYLDMVNNDNWKKELKESCNINIGKTKPNNGNRCTTH